jgi:hypothetical protein
MQYFKTKLTGKPVGTYIKAIQTIQTGEDITGKVGLMPTEIRVIIIPSILHKLLFRLWNKLFAFQ